MEYRVEAIFEVKNPSQGNAYRCFTDVYLEVYDMLLNSEGYLEDPRDQIDRSDPDNPDNEFTDDSLRVQLGVHSLTEEQAQYVKRFIKYHITQYCKAVFDITKI